MSSDRVNPRPLRPVLASNRTARSPLAPRVAVKAGPTATPSSATPRALTRTSITAPRANKTTDDAPAKESNGSGNITPRSGVRKSRAESSHDSPIQDDGQSGTWPRSAAPPALAPSDRNGGVGGPVLGRPKVSKSLSVVGDSSTRGAQSAMVYRPYTTPDAMTPGSGDGFESRFFHASDMLKQEPAPKRPEPKKVPTFFYADGQEDVTTVSIPVPPPRSPSPINPAVVESRPSAPWMRSEPVPSTVKTTPVLSPTLSSLAAGSPFFTPMSSSHLQPRSPSPSKENIHLSYRKGASQIFGTRPLSRPTTASIMESASLTVHDGTARPRSSPKHRKSGSLSSIDSGNSHQSRRRSATAVDLATLASNLPLEPTAVAPTQMPVVPTILPTIDTSLAMSSRAISPPLDGALSPTKFGSSELAADARRERKVLDLEISNSSLLAINASLEREVRRQRAELKRYRRLSRAGHFPLSSGEHSARHSDGLDTLDEELSEGPEAFNLSAGMTHLQDDFTDSDEDEGSVLSGGDTVLTEMQSGRHQDRLAKDELRLRLDLQRHKELLVQSQGMNQSLKRCMYATEEMIKDGRRALQYHVRVSDIKLGGRILTGHEEDDDAEREQIEVEDDYDLDVTDVTEGDQGAMESAQDLLDVWTGLGRPRLHGSEGSGDRDSGIEVDKPFARASAGLHSDVSIPRNDSGRPPEIDHIQEVTAVHFTAKASPEVSNEASGVP